MNEYGINPIESIAEPVASITHLLGAGLFALLSIPILMRAWKGHVREPSLAPRYVRVTSVGIFCASVVLLLTVSGLYHLTGFNTRAREILLEVDYAAIFILIAGTFTPTCAILLRRFEGWLGLGVIWVSVFVAVVLRKLPSTVDLIDPFAIYFVFLGLGWLGVFAIAVVWRRHGASFVELAVLGGVAYTAGAAFQISFRPVLIPGLIGPHELLHIAVLIGIACHWRFVYQFADGHAPIYERAKKASAPTAIADQSAAPVTEPPAIPARPASRV